MDRLARMSVQDRQDVFIEAAARLGIRPAIIEKDFWACVVLKLLFQKSRFAKSLVFKGGTSLSKAYGLIERMSEDIDLVLDWGLIGFGSGSRDPMQDFASKSKQDRFNKEMNSLAAFYIAEIFYPELNDLLQQEEVGLSAEPDPGKPHIVNIHYPAEFSEDYLRRKVFLEIGPLASWVPSAPHLIRPYAFDVVPEVFQNPDFHVLTIAPERTFWEKATILHQESHRETQIPEKYSRHYYDLYKLALSPIRARAIASPKLLQDVVEFKRRFYPSAWARYEFAVPGSFRLLPPTPAHIRALERDYANMQVMFFGESPEFDAILMELKALETEINSIPE